MRRCPSCNQTFSDPSVIFCIEDGTPLVKAEPPAYDSEATIVSASPSQVEGDRASGTDQGAPSDWKGPAYQPPVQFPPPPPARAKKLWPWVVGTLAVLILVALGLGIGAAVFIPKMMKKAQNKNENRSSAPATSGSTNTNSNPGDNTNSNAGDNANSNAGDNANSGLNLNQNSAETTNSTTGPSDNEDVVLIELKNLEDEWTAANINADKKALARILADDYVDTSGNGSMRGKADYLRDIKPDPTIQHWQFENLKLALNGSRATLTGTVSLESSEREEPLELRFTDKFVWRDGRWQAVASEVAPVKESKN